MKVYVAGRMSAPASIGRVQRVMDAVERAGHAVTYDWTRLPDNGPDEELPYDVRERIAARERVAVLVSDLLIVLHEPDMLGTLIEAGIAIGSDIPLWVVDCGGRESIWWHLPKVRRFANETLMLAALERETPRQQG